MRNELGQWLDHQFLLWQLNQGGSTTVGEFAKYLGVSRDALYKWMNGQRVPDLECVEKLADKLGPEVYALVGLPLPNQQLLRIKRSWEDLSEAEQEAFAAEVERMAASNKEQVSEKKTRERVSKKTSVTRPAKSGGGFDNVPWCIFGIGLFNEFIDNRKIGIITVIEIPDTGSYQPCSERVPLPLQKPDFLFVLTDM